MDTASKEQVAARLREARKRIFATAKEAADALNMKDVTVRAHESGRNGVSYSDLERYARRYGVAQMWLLTGQGKQVPSADFTSELGVLVAVEGFVDDDSWFPAAVGPEEFTRTEEGYEEQVSYTDPRFPESMIGALKVRTSSDRHTYLNGTILFCIDASEVPIRDGDHVVLARTRGEFDNASVRLVDADTDGTRMFRSLTSDSPPVRWVETDKEELPHVAALVVGSLTRRPAPRLEAEQIRRWEQLKAATARRMRARADG